MSVPTYPKRLIEVDLPISRISTHARDEKDSRCGHIPRFHIYPAARPLAACRAAICASVWLDPVDLQSWRKKGQEVLAGDTVIRPARFLDAARKCMNEWGKHHLSKVGANSYRTFIKVQQGITVLDDPAELRRALLDFIADFANWDNSTDKDYLRTAQRLTQAAHEAVGGEPGSRPLLVDPFSGGGAIPLEGLRIGTDSFAFDSNPLAVLIDKIVLQYAPKYGDRLASDVLTWGKEVNNEANKIL